MAANLWARRIEAALIRSDSLPIGRRSVSGSGEVTSLSGGLQYLLKQAIGLLFTQCTTGAEGVESEGCSS